MQSVTKFWQRSDSAWRGPTSGVAGGGDSFHCPVWQSPRGGKTNVLNLKKKKIRSSALPNCHITEPKPVICHVNNVEGGEVPPRGKFHAKVDIKKSLNATVKLLKAKIQYLPVYDNTLLRTPWTRVFSWEADRFSASQEMPRVLGNPKFHYRCKCPTPDPYPEPARSSPHPQILLPEDPP